MKIGQTSCTWVPTFHGPDMADALAAINRKYRFIAGSETVAGPTAPSQRIPLGPGLHPREWHDSYRGPGASWKFTKRFATDFSHIRDTVMPKDIQFIENTAEYKRFINSALWHAIVQEMDDIKQNGRNASYHHRHGVSIDTKILVWDDFTSCGVSIWEDRPFSFDLTTDYIAIEWDTGGNSYYYTSIECGGEFRSLTDYEVAMFAIALKNRYPDKFYVRLYLERVHTGDRENDIHVLYTPGVITAPKAEPKAPPKPKFQDIY